MANEVSALNIGGDNYPIYSEGVRLESFNNINRYGSYNLVMGNGSPSYSKLAISPIGFQANDDNTFGLTIPAATSYTNINSESTNIIGNSVQITVSNADDLQDIPYQTYQSGSIHAEPDMVEISNIFDDGTNNRLAKLLLSDTYTSYAHLGVEYNIPEDGTHSWASIDMDSDGDSRIAINGKSVFINDNNDAHLGEENDFNYVGIGNNVYTNPEYEGHEPRHSNVEIGSNARNITIGNNARNITIGGSSDTASFLSVGTVVVSGSYTLINGNNSTVLTGNTNRIQIGNYAKSTSAGSTEGVNGIGLSTGTRSTGTYNSIDLYGSQININQVTDCDTSDETTCGLNISDKSIMLSVVDSANGVIKSHLDVLENNIFLYAGASIDLSSENITIGAVGSSTIIIGNSYADAGTQLCEIRPSNIYFCKRSGDTSSYPGFKMVITSATSSSNCFAPYRVYGNATNNVVNLGGSLNYDRWTNIYSVYSVSTSSDERLKDFGDDIKVNLDDLSTLRKSYYTWKNSEDNQVCVGMSAQEVQKLYPEIVDTDEEGYLSMSYERLAVVALAAIDKLHDENKQLKERLTRLENIVNDKLSSL